MEADYDHRSYPADQAPPVSSLCQADQEQQAVQSGQTHQKQQTYQS
jgi:hypothetical protein